VKSQKLFRGSYANDKVNLNFETSDSDEENTILSPSCSPVNTNNYTINTVTVHLLELDIQRAWKQTHFPCHVERKHALEPEVRSCILMPTKSKERIRQLELLKNKGNFHYNKNISKKRLTYSW